MKKIILVLLLAFVAEHAPWRLAYVYARMVPASRGMTRTDAGQDAYWRALDMQSRLEELGWSVSYDALGGQAYGMSFPQTRKIVVEEALSWNARLATLAHEGGHALAPGNLGQRQGECFAESVAAIVERANYAEHARYLAWVKADCLLTIPAYWSDVYRVADFLETR